MDGQYSDTSRSKKVDDAEVAVVDTPGVLTDNLKDIVSGADVVVIPVRPTPNDIEPFTRTVSIVEKNTKAPVVIVVNGHNRFRMCASFMEWLGKKPWAKNVVTVPQSEAVVQAQGMHKSVLKVDRHGIAAEAIRMMCRKVSSLAGLPFEHKELKK
ncbi:chromosome partitioning protein [Lacrimispora sp. NSJ-141]|uniref:Chromosome partitioning protein n=1 Tax=Lientehia hominis TaxID=2897778 RepID=A0AAP2RIX1_9FIRM|nr:chromosome partitioning protein [Lientehia hominis]MCD2492470.1 chromosome partitioning protein [Lientehia hominis]